MRGYSLSDFKQQQQKTSNDFISTFQLSHVTPGPDLPKNDLHLGNFLDVTDDMQYIHIPQHFT